MPPCTLMKAAPTPIFISLGGGNKVTDSDIDRWPLPASHVRIIMPPVSALFHSGRQHAASRGRKHRSIGSGFNIHYNTLFITQAAQS